MNRIISDYKSRYVVLASRPSNGKTSTILENIREDLLNDKKVLFFSLENGKDNIIERGNFKDLDNLVILDSPIKDINTINNSITKYNPNVVYIDYLDLLPNTKEADELLYQATRDYNIPIIATRNLSMENDNYDLSTITIEEFSTINGSVDKVDNYCLLYINDKSNLNIRRLK